MKFCSVELIGEWGEGRPWILPEVERKIERGTLVTINLEESRYLIEMDLLSTQTTHPFPQRKELFFPY